MTVHMVAWKSSVNAITFNKEISLLNDGGKFNKIATYFSLMYILLNSTLSECAWEKSWNVTLYTRIIKRNLLKFAAHITFLAYFSTLSVKTKLKYEFQRINEVLWKCTKNVI